MKAEYKTQNKVRIPFTVGKTNYEIVCDSSCWSICRIGKTKKGERTSTGIKFYTTLESCLSGVMEMKVKDMPASSLEELAGNISRAQKAISDMYKLTVDLGELEDAV